jgi:flagellar biosynthetic protein FliR
MVAFVGAPALTLGGLALVALAAPAMLAAWLDAFDAYLADPAGAVR